jgi:hypothetical protein
MPATPNATMLALIASAQASGIAIGISQGTYEELLEYGLPEETLAKFRVAEEFPEQAILVCMFSGEPGSTVLYKGVEFRVEAPAKGIPVDYGRCDNCGMGIYWSVRSASMVTKSGPANHWCMGCAISTSVKSATKEAREDVAELNWEERD